MSENVHGAAIGIDAGPGPGPGPDGGPPAGARVHHFLERQAKLRPHAPAVFGETLAGDASSVLRLDWAGYLAAVDEVAKILGAHGARAGATACSSWRRTARRWPCRSSPPRASAPWPCP